MRSARSSAPRKLKRTAKQKTILFCELQELSFCNAKRMPQRVALNGQLMEWVGIGWIPIRDKPTGEEPVVVE